MHNVHPHKQDPEWKYKLFDIISLILLSYIQVKWKTGLAFHDILYFILTDQTMFHQFKIFFF